MSSEYDQILVEIQKARKSAIGNTIGFVVGVVITLLTYLSPSPIFLIAWGAIIFCPIAAVRSYRRYKKLQAISQPSLHHT